MSPFYKTLALVLCGATLAAFTTSAFAKPKHGRRGHAVTVTAPVVDRFSAAVASGAAPEAVPTAAGTKNDAAAQRSFACSNGLP